MPLKKSADVKNMLQKEILILKMISTCLWIDSLFDIDMELDSFT